jgi:hypothetical protein
MRSTTEFVRQGKRRSGCVSLAARPPSIRYGRKLKEETSVAFRIIKCTAFRFLIMLANNIGLRIIPAPAAITRRGGKI